MTDTTRLPLQSAAATHTRPEPPRHPARPIAALWALLRGLSAAPSAALCRGLVAVLLRTAVVHFAEDAGLVPRDLADLHERLQAGRGAGAWRRLMRCLRRLPAGEPLALDAVAALSVTDAAVLQALDALRGAALHEHGVEVLGDLYATLMGSALARATAPSLALRPDDTVISLQALRAQPPSARVGWLREAAGCTLTARSRRALQAAETIEDLVAALRSRRSAHTPGLLPEGALYRKAGTARRRSGSHYTPRAVSGPIVAATIEPLLKGRRVLSLRVCDPAMGAGAFLIEAGRQLADALVSQGTHTPAQARRLVATRCLYGVDLDPVAVCLARLSLWLFVRDPACSVDDVGRQLRVGNAVVGLSPAEISAFCEGTPCAVSVREAADVCIASFFDAGGKPTLREPYRAMLARPEEARAVIARMAPRPLHWSLAFPEVFSGDDPGFDAVIGNPPFRNAVEATTARSSVSAAYFRAAFPRFARGAYDYCLLFWAQLDRLLRRRGRYGMLSPTVLLSSTKPWQQWMHANLRPDGLLLLPVDQFPVARVRTVGLIGGRGALPRYRVENRDDTRPQASFSRDWDPQLTNWFEATRSDAVRLDACPVPLVPLSRWADLSAGCTTGGAYTLRPLVEDAREGPGPRLITTGAIDRYRSKWGQQPIRFLKRDHDHPRWPAGDTLPPALMRARDAQRGATILVGGLTAVIEAWLDEAGDSAGVVQTWVIRPRDPALRYALVGLLNSATFSRVFMQKFGGGAMSGAQTTIKKADLARSLLPALQPEALQAPTAAVLDPTVSIEALPVAVLQAAVARIAARLQERGGEAPRLDRLGHILAGRLFGRTAAQAEDDYRWWAARSRTSPLGGPLEEIRSDPTVRAIF